MTTSLISYPHAQRAQGPRTRPQKFLLRVAVIGCGAVTRQFHLPVLAGHEDVQLVALVDRDLKRAASLAAEYDVAQTSDDAKGLDPNTFDAAVVATPPAFHSRCAMELLRGGSHVLVEKPMAICYQDACEMVDAADDAGKVLSVGLFRRLLPGLGLLKAAIESALLGAVEGFSLDGGAIYGWQAATLGNMRKELAGGGVLMDMGPHFLDQLLFLFDGPGEVIRYEDDSLGGIEADCRLDLRLSHAERPINGRVELSRLRNLKNSLTIHCERGVLELVAGERYRVRVKPKSVKLTDPRTGQARDVQLDACWADEPEKPWYETIRAQVDDFVEAIREEREPVLSGRSALPSMKIIDECYRRREPMEQPWVWAGIKEGLGEEKAEGERQKAENETPKTQDLRPKNSRRVLITGATGFIGTRVAEILHLRDGWDVRALVHNPANASRLARLPVEMVQGDLTNPDDVQRAVEGCDAVVNCAIGTAYGNRREIFRVTVGGAKNLVEAAVAEKVRRFVHISSIAVYGDDATGILDESTSVRPGRDDYSASKAAAEQLVLHATKRGLSAITLRPGCVYGPYGATFTSRPIEHLLRGKLVLHGSADTPSNTMYVDNLAEAIARSLVADASATGNAFTIADDDGLTWGEFYEYFANALDARLRVENKAVLKNHAAKNGWIRALGDIARSAEVKELAKKVLSTDPVGRLPRGILESSPRFKQWLRRKLSMDRPLIYRRSSQDENGLLEITARHAEVKSGGARDELGYKPLVSRDEALRLTLDWLNFSCVA